MSRTAFALEAVAKVAAATVALPGSSFRALDAGAGLP
jgi:hypothetical protein